MSQPAIYERSVPAPQAIIGEAGPGLRLVGRRTRESADYQQQRRAFARRCEGVAWRLATTSPEERIAIYASGVFTGRELSTASALRPDLIPTLNGEFEWIALTMADLD